MAFIYHVFQNREAAYFQRKYLVKKIIMVTSQVKYPCFVAINHFQNPIENTGMFSLPASGFLQLPSVDYISIKDQVFTLMLFKKSDHFFSLGPFGAKVNVREDDGFKACFQNVLILKAI